MLVAQRMGGVFGLDLGEANPMSENLPTLPFIYPMIILASVRCGYSSQ